MHSGEQFQNQVNKTDFCYCSVFVYFLFLRQRTWRSLWVTYYYNFHYDLFDFIYCFYY